MLVVGIALTGCTGPKPTNPAVAADGWQDEMLAAVNAARSANGAPPVTLCGALTKAAQAHSTDQAAHESMSHLGSDNSSVSDRVARAGYVGWTGIAENVAAGYGDVKSVMEGWLGSPGHRMNLLEPSYTHLGLGGAKSGDTPYWTQNFGAGGSC